MHSVLEKMAPSQPLTNRQGKDPLPEREIREAALRGAGAETEGQRLISLLNEVPGIIYQRGPGHAIHFANRNFWQGFGDPTSRE
jgi:hypothetical protein